MALVSMKQQAVDAYAPTEQSLPDRLADDYGYGLCINLGKEQCAALGISSLPEPGTVVMLQARAVVTRTSIVNDGDNDDPEHNLSLQITDLDLGDAPKSAGELASALYGG